MVRFLGGAAAAMALMFMSLGCAVGRKDFLLLVAGSVLRPGDVSVLLWSVGVLASLVLVGTVVLRRRAVTKRGSVLALVAGVSLAGVVLMTGAWCVGGSVLSNGVAALGADAYTTVRPPEGDGCTVIAHEQGALRTSSGTVYLVGFAGIARPVGSWTADEVQLPVHDGTYSISWNESVGQLYLHGEKPSMPDGFPLICEN